MSARHAQIRQGKDFHQLRCFLGQPWKRTFTSSNSLLRLAHRWRASLRLEQLSSDLRIERHVLRFRWGYLGKLDVTVSVRGHYGDNGIKADFTEGICMLLRADTKRALLNHRERATDTPQLYPRFDRSTWTFPIIRCVSLAGPILRTF